MKRFLIFVAIALLITQNVFAICDHERGERDKFRALCFSFAGASTVIAYGAGSLIHPLAGLSGIVPGLVANNQCRIWQEKEENLARCEGDYARAQQAELERQRREVASMKAHNDHISEIDSRYNQLEKTAKTNHQTNIRNLMQNFMQQGRNMRDPLVQTELRQEVQRMETELESEIKRLTEERLREINAVG